MTASRETKSKSRPGLVSVEKGVIKVMGPSPGEEPATIMPTEDITVKVNDNLITGKTQVTEEDIIVVEPQVNITPANLKVTVSKDKMKAFLRIDPEIKVSYVLKDQPFTRNAKLEAVPVKQETNPYGFSDVMYEINTQGITQVDAKAVMNALHNLGVEPVIIASGKPPAFPRDEDIDVKFAAQEGAKPAIKADGRVDFRECSGKIFSVEAGDIIAVKLPGAPGEPGIDVYGQTVQPREPKKVFLQVGNGARLAEEDAIIIATSAGQPQISKSGSNYHISVQPTLVHKGNVSIDFGNIRFKGNVHVTGNVDEGMLVSGSGEVQIDGLVSSATVISGHDLIFHGHLLASKVEAGAALSSINKLLPLMEELEQSMSKLLINVRQVLPKFQGQAPFGNVVALLLEKKFPSFRNQVKNILEIAENNSQLLGEMEELALLLRQKFWGINVLQLAGIEDLKELADILGKTKQYFQILLQNKANVRLGYALNSQIEASGDVYVAGKGCIDTGIKAGGAVYASGIYRGGSIDAQDNVFLEEVGSKIGIPTYIKVPEDKCIFIKKAFENVSLQVGDRQITLNNSMHKKEVSMDVYGVIQFADWEPEKGTGGPTSK